MLLPVFSAPTTVLCMKLTLTLQTAPMRGAQSLAFPKSVQPAPSPSRLLRWIWVLPTGRKTGREEGEQKTMSKTIRKYCRRETIAYAILACAAIAVVALLVASPNSLAAGKKTKIDTPTISCAGSTQASINIQVTAPSGANATGLPAGFSIQWITAEAYAAGPDGVPGTADDNSWPASDGNLCKASFSGNANLSRYNLL